MAKGGDVFVLDMGDPIKILDLKLQNDSFKWIKAQLTLQTLMEI